RRTGDVDQPVRRLLRHQPRHRRQGLRPARGRRRALQAPGRGHVRGRGRTRNPAGDAAHALFRRCAGPCPRRGRNDRNRARGHPRLRQGPHQEARSMTPTLSVRNLTQTFGETHALADISLTLATPGIHGLLGRNGSGKTTLMSIIAGFRKPTTGSVSLDGGPVYENYAATTRICIIRESGDTTTEWTDTIAEAMALARDMR